jgi:hypothetical protein
MNGFISKATILSIIFSLVTFLSSLTYASNTTKQDNGDIKNQSKRLTAGAGCMGCHQGETIAATESMSKSSEPKPQDQKSKDTPTVSKHKV